MELREPIGAALLSRAAFADEIKIESEKYLHETIQDETSEMLYRIEVEWSYIDNCTERFSR